ncbi:MAG: aminotransferase class V-fold PLP-dependent enzyme [Alphaproteobacteria bacterium]|nr:aminotransferase class V-fold PLP-dependent enzyme [Alphaproteobacteria bacterium]
MQPGDRSLFPDLRGVAYLNHAAVGPLPRPARDAMHAAVDRQAEEGVACVGPLLGQAARCRDHLAALLQCAPEHVALTGSTSEGVVAVAQSFPWSGGDRIVLIDGEFPTNTTPWQVAATLHGLEVTWLPLAAFHGPSGDGLSRLEAVLRGGARLVAVSAVQFRTGLAMPVAAMAALAHAHGAWIVVDAIQGLGCVPMALGDVDVLVTGGQKWLMGPLGTGAVVARAPAWQAFTPRMASWLSHVDPLRFLFDGPGALTYDRPLQAGPALFEGGTRNVHGLVGLAASLEVLRDVGVEATWHHVQAWLDGLEDGLLGRGFVSHRSPVAAQRSGILAVAPPAGHTASRLAAALGAQGVSVSTPDGLLRFSPSWPNRFDELRPVLDAVDTALAQGPG